MSNQYERCSICNKETLVSCTNADADLGIIYVSGKLICSDCLEEIKGGQNTQTKGE